MNKLLIGIALAVALIIAPTAQAGGGYQSTTDAVIEGAAVSIAVNAVRGIAGLFMPHKANPGAPAGAPPTSANPPNGNSSNQGYAGYGSKGVGKLYWRCNAGVCGYYP